jgi:hypothetical protein
VGDDANPCSRTAPCKTFAGAISKTAAGGEINCLDPGGFGGVTIGKSLTIKCQYTEGGVLVSGTNAIVVNAAATDRVTIRGLDIFGIGTGAQTSLSGIKVLQAGQVNIMDNEIYRFKAGIVVAPTASAKVVVVRNHIHENGIGLINAPGSNAIGFTSVVMRDNDVQDNTCGVVSGAFGTNGSTPDAAVNCGTAASAGIDRPTITAVYHSGLNLNGFGLFSRGGNSSAEIAWDEITSNTSFGVRRLDGGHVRTFTPATNVISNNAATDAPDQSTPLAKRAAKRLRKRGPGR